VPPGLPATTAILLPREEPTRAWLERLDATAAALAAPAVYRAPEIETGDLWTALESPDAPASVRAGAARILARVAPVEARTRIARVLEADHDERAKARIRIALEDDVEVAARRLDHLGRR
jgi:urease accessory protein UreE